MVDLITEHIATWTGAEVPQANGGRGRGRGSNGKNPHGIKKLRQLILELAVRGKLVPQDPNDEPASVLLEKFAKEKARLIKEGKIKKQKPLPEISEDEKPFHLPDGWAWVRFQDVSIYIQRGKGPKYADQGTVRVVSQKCVQWSGFDIAQARFVDDSSLQAYQPERFLVTNDLLWNSTGTGTVGRVNVLKDIEKSTLVADSHVTVIRPLHISSDFLSCYIAASGIQQRIEPEHEKSLVSGTTKQVELNTISVQSLLVPIAPLAEQHRIVAKVDELMALCDKLEQRQTDSSATHQTLVETLLATLTTVAEPAEFALSWQRIAGHFDTLFTTEESIDQLKQTILQLAVMGKLVPQNPNDEPASRLLEKIAKEKARLIKEGKIKKQKPLQKISDDEKSFDLPKGWEWSHVGDCFTLMSGTSFDKGRELNVGPYVYAKVADMNLEGNEVEITTSSRFLDPTDKEIKALIPPGSVIFPKRGGAIATNKKRFVKKDLFVDLNIMAITPFTGISLEYAYRWLMGIDLAELNSGTSVPQINNKDIAPLLFPVPPLAEQHRIVAKVDELMALCDTLKERLHDAQITQVQLADAIVEQAVA